MGGFYPPAPISLDATEEDGATSVFTVLMPKLIRQVVLKRNRLMESLMAESLIKDKGEQ